MSAGSAVSAGAVRILPVDAASVVRLARLHAASFDEPWDAASIARILAMPGAFGFLAEPEGSINIHDEIAGFILVRVAADEAEILTIAVAAHHRRRGLGRLLVEAAAAAAIAAGATALFLEVADDNTPALRLYEGQGFRAVGLRPGYYRRSAGTAAARVMRLDLSARP